MLMLKRCSAVADRKVPGPERMRDEGTSEPKLEQLLGSPVHRTAT